MNLLLAFFDEVTAHKESILATTLSGAYATLLGLAHLFPSVFGIGRDYLSAQIPFSVPAFLVFVIFLVTGILGQFGIRRVRGRYVNLR